MSFQTKCAAACAVMLVAAGVIYSIDALNQDRADGRNALAEANSISQVVADVSILMIAADGVVLEDEVRFARNLGQKYQMLETGQGLWPVTSNLLSHHFSVAEYQARLSDGLRYLQEGALTPLSPAQETSEVDDIVGEAHRMDTSGGLFVLVGAAANVWAKQSFTQKSGQAMHDDFRHRERINGRF